VESHKTEVEEQVEGVLGVFVLLSTNKLNLSCVLEVVMGCPRLRK
jgi:hypothetical protein